jgi:hypothetical protein
MTTSSPTMIARQTPSWPHRGILTGAEVLVSLSAMAGSVYVFADGAPLRSELPLGLPSPLVPGLWLLSWSP